MSSEAKPKVFFEQAKAAHELITRALTNPGRLTFKERKEIVSFFNNPFFLAESASACDNSIDSVTRVFFYLQEDLIRLMATKFLKELEKKYRV